MLRWMLHDSVLFRFSWYEEFVIFGYHIRNFIHKQILNFFWVILCSMSKATGILEFSTEKRNFSQLEKKILYKIFLKMISLRKNLTKLWISYRLQFYSYLKYFSQTKCTKNDYTSSWKVQLCYSICLYNWRWKIWITIYIFENIGETVIFIE